MKKRFKAALATLTVPVLAAGALLAVGPGLAFADVSKVMVGGGSSKFEFKTNAYGTINADIEVGNASGWSYSTSDEEACYVLSVADPEGLFAEGKEAKATLAASGEATRDAVDPIYISDGVIYNTMPGDYLYNTDGHSVKGSFAKTFHVYRDSVGGTLTFRMNALYLKPNTSYSFDVRAFVHEHTEYAPAVLKRGSFKTWGETGGECTACGTVPNHGKYMKFKASKTVYGNQDVSYTGKKAHPDVSLWYTYSSPHDEDDGAWMPKKDYKVVWPKNSVKVGTYTAKIVLTGDKWVKGSTKSFKYSIVPAPTSIKKIKASKTRATIPWKVKTKENAGYQIRYSTKDLSNLEANYDDGDDEDNRVDLKAIKKSVKVKTIKGAKTGKAVIKNLKKNKRYTVQVRCWKKVGSKTYYSEWSGTKSFKTKK